MKSKRGTKTAVEELRYRIRQASKVDLDEKSLDAIVAEIDKYYTGQEKPSGNNDHTFFEDESDFLSFQSILKNMKGAVYQCKNDADWTMLYLSKSIKDLTGYSKDELENNARIAFNDIIHPDDKEMVRNTVKRAIEAQSFFTIEYRIITKSNNEVWLWERGKAVPHDTSDEEFYLMGIFEDVTSKKEVEKELRQNIGLLRSLLDSVPDLIFFKDTNGVYLGCNPEFTRFVGRSKDAIIGKTDYDLFDKDTAAFFISNDQLMLKNLKPRKNEERVSYPDGTEKLLDTLKTPYWGPDGELIGILGIGRDITDRHRMEEDLKKSEESYKYLFDSNPLPMWVYDANTLKFLAVNNTAVEKYGYTREEFLQMNLKDIRPQEEIDQLVENISDRTSTYQFSGPWKHKLKDGTIISVEISSHDLLFANRKARLVTSNDITEKLLAQKALRNSEAKFRHLFYDHSAIKLIIDPENGRIVEANNAASNFYGWSISEIETMTIDQINTLSKTQLRKVFNALLSEKNKSYEFRHRKADGAVCDVEVFSSTVDIDGRTYVHSIIHDITEKKKAENQLRLLSRSVEQSPTIIIITDKQGVIQYVNKTFTQITGYAADEAIGKNPNLLKSEYQDQHFYEEMWKTILSGKDWYGEMKNKKKNGELFWEEAIISPIFDEMGNITHFVGIKEEITEKKNMIKELISAKEKAEESDRLKSAFLTNLSHEIRTPMNGIIGFLEVLQDKDITTDERDKYINIVNKSGKRLLNTINDIVEISRIDSGQITIDKTHFKLDDFFSYLQNFHQEAATAKQIDLKLETDKKQCGELYCDRNKLESVMNNLINNAIKFTSSGYVKIGCKNEGKNMIFFVEDTGKGIHKDRQQAIFDRFVQADLKITRAHEGSGLGLSISREYVKRMGGRLWVESKEGHGSTFYMSISENLVNPNAQQEKLEKQQSSEEIRHSLDGNGRLVLIAEDEEDSYLYLQIILKNLNFRILWAHNGEEAVNYCKNNKDIALVLMDIKLPVMDGLEATQRIKAFNPDMPVIAQTAYALSGDRKVALEAGCDDYVDKPIHIDAFIEVLKRNLPEQK